MERQSMMLLHYFETIFGRDFSVMNDGIPIYFISENCKEPLTVKVENNGKPTFFQFGNNLAQVSDCSHMQVGKELPIKRILNGFSLLNVNLSTGGNGRCLESHNYENLEFHIKFFICIFHVMPTGSFEG